MKNHKADPLYRENREHDETVGLSESFEDWHRARGPEANARVEALIKEWKEVEKRGEDISDFTAKSLLKRAKSRMNAHRARRGKRP